MVKKIILFLTVIFFSFMFMSQKAQAMTTIKSSNSSGDISIESNEIIDDNVAIAGNNIYIRGIINDDVFVAGSNIKIEGEIKGNLFAAGNTIDITGKIDKDAFIGGNLVSINENASIGRDLFTGGNLVNINGNINRNVFIGGSNVNLNGKVEGNANMAVQSLNLGENSQITGKLDYQAGEEISQEQNSHVVGEINYNQPDEKTKQNLNFGIDFSSWFITLLQFLFVGILLAFIIPKWLNIVGETIQKQTWKSIGIGILISIVAPILIIIAFITIVGIPIAIIAGLTYTLLISLARFWVAYCVGLWIGKNKFSPILTMVVGIIILQIFFLIPIVSIFAQIFVMFMGLGSIYIINPLKTAKK